jgi:hypothetical protein
MKKVSTQSLGRKSSAVLKRSPRYQGLEEKPDKNESWHAFKTP